MCDRLASLTEVAVVSGFAEPNAPIPTMADKTNAVRMLDQYFLQGNRTGQ
jgi:hypothetical protein